MKRLATSLWPIISLVASAFYAHVCAAQTLVRLGPEGGQVISLAAGEKGEVLLGTTDGHIFASADEGRAWELRGHLSERWDAVVQTMLVDSEIPKRIFAGVWYQDPTAGGGIFWSEDGGATWRRRGLAGETVRALAQSARDAKVLVAGTKTGVFRTKDAGATWERISPEGDAELRNLDSIAIDPRDANAIYAGTFHLLWKTTDGGKHWTAIAEGMIDDSDIMSIAIDRANPDRIFASACSGIYRSETGGLHWTKLEGIPYAARRTQQISQDPRDSARWFAGTTEGLWETDDGGENWERVLGREMSVNAVTFTRPSGALVLGTEDGVRVASSRRDRFPQSDRGFEHRVLSGSATQDPEGKHLLVAIDGAEPEILESTDGGATWKTAVRPKKNVTRIISLQNRWIASLRGGGVAVFDDETRRWKEWRFLRRVSVSAAKRHVSRTKGGSEIQVFPETRGAVAVGGRVIVATDEGLWSGGLREGAFRKMNLAGPEESFLDLAADGKEILAVTENALAKSEDGGGTWTHLAAPAGAVKLRWGRLVPTTPPRLLVGTSRGVFLGKFRSEGNDPLEWRLLQSGLPASASGSGWVGNGLWAVSSQAGSVYVSSDEGANWERLEAVTAGAARAVANIVSGGVYVETRTDGLVKFAFEGTAAIHSQNGTDGGFKSAKYE